LVDVAMTYAWLTRRSGMPLTWYGPVTSNRPDGSWRRKTTRRPRKRPASRISTVPGVMLLRSFATPREFISRSEATFTGTSSAG